LSRGIASGGHDPYSNSKACAEFVDRQFSATAFYEAGPADRLGRAPGNVIGGGDWSQRSSSFPDCIRALQANKAVTFKIPPMPSDPWAACPSSRCRGLPGPGRRPLVQEHPPAHTARCQFWPKTRHPFCTVREVRGCLQARGFFSGSPGLAARCRRETPRKPAALTLSIGSGNKVHCKWASAALALLSRWAWDRGLVPSPTRPGRGYGGNFFPNRRLRKYQSLPGICAREVRPFSPAAGERASPRNRTRAPKPMVGNRPRVPSCGPHHENCMRLSG